MSESALSFGRWMLPKSLGCSRGLKKKACSVNRGNTDSVLRHCEDTSSAHAGLWPDVGRDLCIRATSNQAVCLAQCRVMALELGGASPPNAALQEADESHLTIHSLWEEASQHWHPHCLPPL